MIKGPGRGAPARVGIAIAVLCSGLVALASPAEAATAWRVVPTAPGTQYGHLSSVSCPIPTSCFAVGVQDSPRRVNKMIERWNGKKWTAVASPNPSGAISSALSSVFCRTPSSCVAVGQYNTLVATRTLILHWNGKAWSQKPSPNPLNMPVSTLAGVHCASATSCVAVGSAYVSTETSSAQVTLIEQWDGVRWTIVPSPNQPLAFDSGLSSVACPRLTTCYAVGSYEIQNLTNTLIEQWDGVAWSIVPSPNAPNTVFNDLAGVSCTSTTSCFAVGDQFKNHVFQRLVEMWNGVRWSLVGVPVPSGTKKSALSGVSCATPASCFAVGDFRLGKSRRPLLERYS